MTIELKSYDLDIAELIIIVRCIHDNPDVHGSDIAKMLGISKSSFYRKLKLLSLPLYHDKLIDHGYSLTFVKHVKQIL